MANEFLTRNEEIVDGIYRLGALIRRSARSVVYETEFGEGGAPAVIRIRAVESAGAENLRQRLRNARQLAHPNLLKIYATGFSMLDDRPVSYVVMERADESLEEVLASRALTTSETREMLLPALDALQYLHNKGYAHGRLKPSNFLAVDDQLKLSSDSVIRFSDGESAADNRTAEDMRAMGVLIIQALTRKIPNADESWKSQGFEEIPQPLADIARHCLDSDCARRWTAEQVKAGLNAPAIDPVVPTGRLLVAEMSQSAEDSDKGGAKSGIPKWIYVGLAAMILIVLVAAMVGRKNSAPVAIPVAAAPTAAEPGGSGGVEAAPVTPAPQAAAPPAGSPLAERKASGWSVIVAAYGSREPAEKRMRQMQKRFPNFEISVLETQAEKTHYLLVLGRNLSEDEAEALRGRAVDSGLPRQTYIKRVM